MHLAGRVMVYRVDMADPPASFRDAIVVPVDGDGACDEGEVVEPAAGEEPVAAARTQLSGMEELVPPAEMLDRAGYRDHDVNVRGNLGRNTSYHHRL